MQYWQLASGDATRDYAEVFLNFGIASLGPGDPGPINDDTIPIYKEKKEYDKIYPITQVKTGDKIILRNGQRIIQAVGEVVEYNGNVYNYSNCFSDIDGWDLQHFVKIKWKKIEKTYSGNKMTRSTMQRLFQETVIEDVENEWENKPFISDKYPITEPCENEKLSYEEIEEFLILNGHRISDAENVRNTIHRVEKLANWYITNHKTIVATEHEIRTFLVVPFLDALGWSSQLISIEKSVERKKLDILLHDNSDRANPKILIETKNMFEGSALAISQAKSYLQLNALKNVVSFCVTDGFRYWLYKKQNNVDWLPYAYMNFRNKRKNYTAYPHCKGMLDFIKEIMR